MRDRLDASAPADAKAEAPDGGGALSVFREESVPGSRRDHGVVRVTAFSRGHPGVDALARPFDACGPDDILFRFWLKLCVDFGVFDSSRRVGRVVGLHYRSRGDVPDFLVVRSGIVRRRHREIPAHAIVRVVPSKRRVIVSRHLVAARPDGSAI
jgi:hypothetical protein